MKNPELIAPYFPKEGELFQTSSDIWGVSRNVRAQKLDAHHKEKTILMMSGLSGAGKDAIVDELVKAQGRMVRVRTLTNRVRRPEEMEDDDPYERVTTGQFEDYLKKGQIIEYTEYAGNFYGTKKGTIEEALSTHRIPILRVDPRGANFYLREWRKGNPLFEKATLIYFFVIPPSIETLRERLLSRSKDADFVEKRLRQSLDDITRVGEAEYIVINENGKLKEAVEQILAILS